MTAPEDKVAQPMGIGELPGNRRVGIRRAGRVVGEYTASLQVRRADPDKLARQRQRGIGRPAPGVVDCDQVELVSSAPEPATPVVNVDMHPGVGQQLLYLGILPGERPVTGVDLDSVDTLKPGKPRMTWTQAPVLRPMIRARLVCGCIAATAYQR